MPDITAWKTYVSKLAKRYGARIDYQLWPEPNIIQNWTGTPAQMAKLGAVAAKAIHGIAGNAMVVSPAVALRLDSQQAWTVKYFKQSVGGKRIATYLDAIAIDPFPLVTGKPEDSYRIMTSIQRKLGKIGVHKPYWNNEINYGVAGGHDPSTTTYPVDVQQSFVIRTYVLSAAAKMQRTYWLAWNHSPELAVDMSDANGLPLAPATSYQVVRSWLNTTDFQGCKTNNGLWVCTTKTGSGEVRRIYWKPSGSATVTTPSSTKRVEDQDGGVDSRSGSYKITVGFRPIMVASSR
jgi:hypothetical protein